MEKLARFKASIVILRDNIDNLCSSLTTETPEEILQEYCRLLNSCSQTIDKLFELIQKENQEKLTFIVNEFDSTKQSNPLTGLSQRIAKNSKADKGRWVITAYENLIIGSKYGLERIVETGKENHSPFVPELLEIISISLLPCIQALNSLRQSLQDALQMRTAMRIPSCVSTNNYEQEKMKPIVDRIADKVFGMSSETELSRPIICRS